MCTIMKREKKEKQTMHACVLIKGNLLPQTRRTVSRASSTLLCTLINHFTLTSRPIGTPKQADYRCKEAGNLVRDAALNLRSFYWEKKKREKERERKVDGKEREKGIKRISIEHLVSTELQCDAFKWSKFDP